MQTCARCYEKTNCTIMSKFNTQIICIPCKVKEEKHPAYKAADDAEVAAVKGGNYNFPGVGKPASL